MHFYTYKAFDAFSDQRSQWNALVNDSPSNNPFLSFEYQQSWWQTRGGGEWPQSSQLLLVAGFDDEKLVGIAPLFLANNHLDKPSLLFVGAVEVSDFLDFIARPEDLPEFIQGLMDFLKSDPSLPNWDCLDFHNILEESPSLEILKQQADQRGWNHQQTLLQPAPYIPLPADYDSYLASIDKKQRHEIRRKLRNLTQSSHLEALEIVEDLHLLAEETQSFINLMAQDPNKRDFLRAPMQQHLHNTAQVAFNAGWLQLAFLTLDGKKAAANMAFKYHDRLLLYNSGWEWAFRDFSPGWVLLARLIQWSIENDVKEFDFMRGDERYKYKFGAVDRHVFRVTLTP